MRDTRHGVNPRLAKGFTRLALLLLLPALLPAPSRAADITLSSQTYLLYFEREMAGGKDRQYAPLYEYLSGDASDLGGRPISFHFYGWGRLDLKDDTDSDGRGGDLASAYLQYLHPTGNGQVRLGRFFLAEGTAVEMIDGLFLKAVLGGGFGAALFGGVPVEHSITAADEGDSIYGGRLFFVRPGFAELGVTWLFESGDFQGDDREEVGGDLWIRPGGPVELSGRAVYNVSTSGLASQRYVLRIMPFTSVDTSAGYETYRYEDLFQKALNPAFLPPAVDGSDEVQSLFATVSWEAVENLAVEIGAKILRHDASDPGDATRADLGIRYGYNDRKDAAGLSAAVVSADRDENDYQEYRGFATWSPGTLRFALDALAQRYKKEIGGEKNAFQVVGSAGWQVLPYIRISGDLTYTESPRFKEDYAGLVRASLDLGFGTGGTK